MTDTTTVDCDPLVDRCYKAADTDWFQLAPQWAKDAVNRVLSSAHNPHHPDWQNEDDRPAVLPIPPYAVKEITAALKAVAGAGRKGEADERAAARAPKLYRPARKQHGRKHKATA